MSWKRHLQNVFCDCLGDSVQLIKEQIENNDEERKMETRESSNIQHQEVENVIPKSEYHDKAVVLSSGLGLPVELCELALEKFGGNENNAAEFAFLNLDNMDALIKERRRVKTSLSTKTSSENFE